MLRFLRVPVSAFLFLLVTSISAHAQNAPAPDPDTVRQFAKRSSSRRRDATCPNRKSARRSRCSISQEIEQRHALSTIDLLRTIPGVVAVRTGGVGNLTGVFVRGGESTYNKVLLDGMPLNEPGGAFNFASLSPENIERIEVLRGAHSALFGSDAMASVIQLFSVRPESGRPQLNLTVDGGNYNTTHVAAGLGATHRRHRVFGLRLAPSDRQSRAEQREQDVDRVGHVRRADDIGRLGAVPRPRRVRPHGHAWNHGIRPARHGRVFPPPGRQLPRRMEPAARIARDAADQLHLRHDPIPLDQPDCRPAVHAAVRRSRRGVSILRFSLRLGDRARTASLSVPRGCQHRAEPDADRRLRVRRRARRADEPSIDSGAAAAVAQQHGHHGAVRSEQRPRVACRRHSLREQRQLRLLCRAARRGLVARQLGRQRRARRHAPARQRRTRHQGAAVHPVVQPFAELPRQSRSQARAVARIRRRHRAAVCPESRGARSDLFRQPLRRPDQPRAVRSGHLQRAVRKHRRDARVRPRARRHRLCRTASAIQRRVYVSRFESRSAASAAARSLRRANQLYRRPRHSGSLQASYSRNRVSLALGGVFVG